MSSLSHRILHHGPAAETPLSLELRAQHAGSAWGCEYSTSAEYDAALIAERRAAGLYGPKRQRRQMLTAAAGIAAGLAVIFFTLQLL
ncbi:hypothetical protein [Undibacter mobilis]|uniref:Uncharacterized protein n=1 Tax=Undibacter mobilis TaxID=2292256 RepID=A0A371B177_9BRAD|nr:hypothetical protein [Undibacter mobilis]RDV01308.1 hypothetical protein DXH78_18965 [Undibacter mobilis]